MAYLKEHDEKFRKYLKEQYTSCSGFISSYPNNAGSWLEDNPLEHQHKLGAVLQFILLNEGVEEFDMYYYCSENVYLMEKAS